MTLCGHFASNIILNVTSTHRCLGVPKVQQFLQHTGDQFYVDLIEQEHSLGLSQHRHPCDAQPGSTFDLLVAYRAEIKDVTNN